MLLKTRSKLWSSGPWFVSLFTGVNSLKSKLSWSRSVISISSSIYSPLQKLILIASNAPATLSFEPVFECRVIILGRVFCFAYDFIPEEPFPLFIIYCMIACLSYCLTRSLLKVTFENLPLLMRRPPLSTVDLGSFFSESSLSSVCYCVYYYIVSEAVYFDYEFINNVNM